MASNYSSIMWYNDYTETTYATDFYSDDWDATINNFSD